VGTYLSDRWKYGRLTLYTTMAMVPLGAAWFAILQALILNAFCPWCCATHLVATLAVSLLALHYRNTSQQSADKQVPHLLRCAIPAAVAGVSVLVATQSLSPDLDTVESYKIAGGIEISAPTVDPDAPRILSSHEGRVEFDVKEFPMLGSPNAEYVIAALADYSCGHCRKLHKLLTEVQGEYGDEKLGVVFLPGLRNGDSQKIFEVMLPLWKEKREAFDALEKGLLEGGIAQTPAAVRAAASSHFDTPEQLDTLLAANRPWAIERIKLGVKLFQENSKASGRKVLPQLVIGSEVMVGASKTTEKYFAALGEEFNLERLDSAASEGLEYTDTGGKDPGVANSSIESGPDPGVEQVPVVKKRVADPVTRVRYSRHANYITYDYGEKNGKYSVDVEQLPMWGNLDAETVALFLIDFNSAEARAAGLRLRELQRKIGDEKLAVAILPAMPTGEAQLLHRQLLPMWKQDPSTYLSMVDDILGGKELPKSSDSQEVVAGGDAAKWLQKQLVDTHRIYAANQRASKRRGIPHLMVGDSLFVGGLPSDIDLEKSIEVAGKSPAPAGGEAVVQLTPNNQPE